MTNQGPSSPPEAAAKDAAGVRIFPPAVPALIVIVGLGLEWLFPLGSDWMIASPARVVIGVLLIVAPVYFLGFLGVRAMRQTGQSENPYKPTTEIVESGPFRFTRNPMYLQMVLVCAGVSGLLANLWIALLAPLCAVLLHHLVIRHEEAYLERKFGAAYRAYKSRVRRWI